MFLTDTWQDYEVIDTGNGEKLERWKDVILRRPDPQTIWPQGDPAVFPTGAAVNGSFAGGCRKNGFCAIMT